MDTIRVLIGNHPKMAPDALRRMIEDQEDMELVGDWRGAMKILQEAGKAKADVVILTQEGVEEIGLSSQLLAVYPDLVVVSVAPDLGAACAHLLRAHRQRLRADTQAHIVQSIRAVVREPYGEPRP